MAKPRKKFGQTTVGKILKGTLGLINPTLGSLVQGESSIEEVIAQIKEANVPMEDKVRAQELVLEAYEAEVADRVAARNREAQVAAAGGSDILFKTDRMEYCTSILISCAVCYWYYTTTTRP